MTTTDAAANDASAAAPEPLVASEPRVEGADAPVPTEPEVAVENGDESAPAGPPKKRGRKRKVSVTEDKAPTGDGAMTAEVAGDAPATDAAEKSPKEKKPAAKKPKATKATASATPPKRKLGRPRKIVKEESEDEPDIAGELNKRVEALPEDVKAKFGTIVWAKMVGFPYWPALVTDPRRLHPNLQEGALKELETKYYVCFYQSNNFSSVLYKNIEPWDDTKHDYRAGHPTKDAKAPKRRNHLMIAIELADKEVSLPVEERMNGLMKEVVHEVESETEEEEPKPVVKKRLGRPPGSKNKPKVPVDAADVPSPAPKAKRGRKKSETDESAEKQQTPETPEEDETVPPLSKDEIKAKVASRKTPSKKKAPTAEEKTAAAAAKKAAKASAKSEAAPKGELDSKRKKEIELVVPRKSVKSQDIREATEEAARKKPGPREKPKDKGEYKVGNLTQFAGKMNRLFANESSKNNDELILLLTQLFDEKMVYRSDAERSGVAAVIAALRKSQNPTVAQTASAVRKHLMKVLNDDVTEAANTKKQKAEGDAETKASKKQKTSPPADTESASATPETTASTESPTNGSGEAVKDVPKEEVKAETQEPATEEPAVDVKADEATSVDTKQEPLAPQEPAEAASTETAGVTSAKEEPVKPASPVKSDPVPATSPKPDPSGDKNRMACIEMLKKALVSIGARSEEIAREIEAQVFERFSESNDEYRACARSITFGLKKNPTVCERLNNGDLHALELAYSHEDILKA